MSKPLTDARVRAGQLVQGARSGVRGTLGLIVTDDRCCVYALCAQPVVKVGESANVGDPALGLRLGRSVGLDGGRSASWGASITTLLVLMPLSGRTRFSAAPGGAGGDLECADVSRFLGEPLIMASNRGALRLGAMTAVGATEYFPTGDGFHESFIGAVEIAYSDACPKLEAGDTGAVVLSISGHPLAVVIGSRADCIVAVPIADPLSLQGLRPVTAFDASRRDGDIIQARQLEFASRRKVDHAEGAAASDRLEDTRAPSEHAPGRTRFLKLLKHIKLEREAGAAS